MDMNDPVTYTTMYTSAMVFVGGICILLAIAIVKNFFKGLKSGVKALFLPKNAKIE